MPRAARKKSESGIYHVMSRGINRQTIFEDDEDCEKYLRCLAECKSISGFTLHAYCLMGNHLHLLIQEGKEPLEQIFKRVGARYVFWYNWKYKRSGHLFQDRFKSEPVNDDAYFLTVLRYIYQNPAKAALCKKAEEYHWSSYHELTASSTLRLTDSTKAMELLPRTELLAFLAAPAEEQFLDLTDNTRLTDREAGELVKKLCHLPNLAAFQQLPREKREQHLRKLSKHGCSIRQLSRLTGISKAMVEKAMRG